MVFRFNNAKRRAGIRRAGRERTFRVVPAVVLLIVMAAAGTALASNAAYTGSLLSVAGAAMGFGGVTAGVADGAQAANRGPRLLMESVPGSEPMWAVLFGSGLIGLALVVKRRGRGREAGGR